MYTAPSYATESFRKTILSTIIIRVLIKSNLCFAIEDAYVVFFFLIFFIALLSVPPKAEIYTSRYIIEFLSSFTSEETPAKESDPSFTKFFETYRTS